MKTSETFMDIVCDAGCCSSIDCEFCKRTHFTHEDHDFEALQEKAKAQPDKYLESSNDSIGWGYLDGRQYVYDCPCDSGHRYEEFIWRHRRIIAAYLKRRAENQLASAQEDQATADMI